MSSVTTRQEPLPQRAPKYADTPWGRLRAERRWSLRDLAGRSGVNIGDLSRIERGQQAATPDQARGILEAYEPLRDYRGGGHRFDAPHDCFVANCDGLARDLDRTRQVDMERAEDYYHRLDHARIALAVQAATGRPISDAEGEAIRRQLEEGLGT